MDEKILKSAKGVNGTLELLENRVRIKRKGALSLMLHGLKGDKEILIKQISSIQFKKASNFTNGYIQFAFLGGTEAHGGLLQATQDENTVVFNKWQMSAFEEIKSILEEKMVESTKEVKSGSSLNDLEKLAELKDKGVITEEEFEAKKKQILGL